MHYITINDMFRLVRREQKIYFKPVEYHWCCQELAFTEQYGEVKERWQRVTKWLKPEEMLIWLEQMGAEQEVRQDVEAFSQCA